MGLLRSLSRLLGDAAARESRGRRLLWLGIAFVLVVGSPVLDLTRASHFSASSEFLPLRVGPFPAVRKRKYYRAFLGDATLRRNMRGNIGSVASESGYRSV